MTDISKVSRIREVNDRFRKTFQGGRICCTPGVCALLVPDQISILSMIQNYNLFDENNDPYGEHDFGALTVSDVRIYFKIDYYDCSLCFHSPDPSDPLVTERVMTIMLCDEY
jgi:hypothetical protein